MFKLPNDMQFHTDIMAILFVNNEIIFFFFYYLCTILLHWQDFTDHGDWFLDIMETSLSIFPHLFESFLTIYWSPIFNIFWLAFWRASLELTGPCICCHNQIPSFSSTLQRSLFIHIQSDCNDFTLTLLPFVTAVSVKESNTKDHDAKWGVTYNSAINGLEAP